MTTTPSIKKIDPHKAPRTLALKVAPTKISGPNLIARSKQTPILEYVWFKYDLRMDF